MKLLRVSKKKPLFTLYMHIYYANIFFFYFAIVLICMCLYFILDALNSTIFVVSVLFAWFLFLFTSVFYRPKSYEELEKLLLLSESVCGYHVYHIHSAQNSLLHRQPDFAERNTSRYGHARVHAALRLWRENDLRYLHAYTVLNVTLT
uniref:Uncharacterized protein n=1 Tax=Schizaphis graminum TaxID=13262 RepID=A0A2S2NSP5_SCHGA